MEAEVKAFVESPTVEQLHRFRKKELLQIAKHFKISVPPTAVKADIKAEIFSELLSLALLPEESVITPVHEFDPDVVLKLKELELQIKQQEHETRVLHLRELELVRLTKQEERTHSAASEPQGADRPSQFDPTRYMKLVPQFRESEVDAYFTAFERVAGKLCWPKDMWAVMLQSSFVGKAQEVCSALPIEDSLNYDLVKAAVLRAYELVPEAYRQKFRNHTKASKQTFVEFAHEKKAMLEKWCIASEATTFERLQEFIQRVYTDHNPLIFLNRMYNTNQRLMRWSLALQEFNIEIVHKRGTENVIADALSRAHSAENTS